MSLELVLAVLETDVAATAWVLRMPLDGASSPQSNGRQEEQR